MERLCRNCRSFEQKGTEDSGLKSPHYNGNWVYSVGKCCNIKSVHGGWNANGKTTQPRETMADWNKCEHFKARIAPKKPV